MKTFFGIKYLLTVIFIFICSAEKTLPSSASPDSTPVQKHGQLKVEGNKITDEDGNPVALHGMSLFWSQWMGKYYNASCVEWLVNDWKCTVVRAAMGVESGGYLASPEFEKNKILSVIEACINSGVYVIVDWHDHNAHNHLDEAIGFFTEIAGLYGDTPNLIYEIYNEPTNVSWTNIVKRYAEAVIDTIRKIDPDNLIIVGTPTWSQDVDVASRDPLDYSNIAYALHFYAATHKQFLRNKASSALQNGAALFVSEWGTCESTGSGFLDSAETETWLDFLYRNKIGWCNWSIADKVETASALEPGAGESGFWEEDDLTSSGSLVRGKIIDLYDSVSTDAGSILIPPSFNLRQNYPNPFNPSTKIIYEIASRQKTVLKIYDILGSEISTLVNEEKPAGIYEIEFNSNLNKKTLSSGVYFCRFEAGGFTETKKMILTK